MTGSTNVPPGTFVPSVLLFPPYSTSRSSGVKRKIRVASAELLGEVAGDQLAVEAAIFDENLVCGGTSDNHSRNGHSQNIRFQGLRIADWTHLFRREFNARAPQKIISGMVAGEREDEIIFQAQRAGGSAQNDAIFVDLPYRAVEMRGDLSGFDAVLDIGAHPVFNVVVNLRSAMDESDPRSVPPQIESRFRRRILTADDQHVGVEIGMRLAIIMEDFLQTFSGDLQLVGEIVIAGGENDFARAVVMDGAVTVAGGDAKIVILTRDRFHPLIEADIDTIVLGDAAVIFERIEPRRLRR